MSAHLGVDGAGARVVGGDRTGGVRGVGTSAGARDGTRGGGRAGCGDLAGCGGLPALDGRAAL
ncbi:MAG TPA: hypothetical protein VIK13_09910, partial [Candidatus Limnocylindrales bacterium]